MDATAVEEAGGHPFRSNSEGVRASLLAVREAQAAASARNRRETWKARALVGTAAVTFFVGLAVLRTEAAHKRATPRAATPAAISSASRSPAPQAAPVAALPVAPPSASQAVPVEPAATPSVAKVSTPEASASAGAAADCVALSARHRWREAAEPCASAVKAHPNDAAMILRLAEAEHARNHLAEAGTWAKRAIALDANLPEAFIIEAHAEAHAGNTARAARSFRRYLALAPRGWHAQEARDALHAQLGDRGA